VGNSRGGCEEQSKDERCLQGELHEKRNRLSTGRWRRQLLRFVHRDAPCASSPDFRETDDGTRRTFKLGTTV
jgi:hypothetical protein